MKSFYLGWATLLLAGPALAQSAGPPKPAQSITLDDHATVGGVVTLPNQNTVLLLTNSAKTDVVAQCLAPDGHTVWKTPLTRYQYSLFNSGHLLDNRQIALGQPARDRKQLAKEMTAASLWPVNVFTDGNELVLAEVLGADAAKESVKSGSTKLATDQVFVQRLDAQGHLTQHLFEPPAAPESRKVEVRTLGRYADAAGYVEVVRELNTREETTTFYLQHYDLATRALRREPVVLPPTPKQPNNMFLRHWYQDWAFLGHRPGQTYFSRRTLEGGPKAKPGDLPTNFQVFVVDDHGAAAASGFHTTLELTTGTHPAYSGRVPGLGGANHIPYYFNMSQGKNYIRMDEYEVSSGGVGGLYLDHATGDVLVYGEYALGEVLMDGSSTKLDGVFMRRYAADGRVLASAQLPYTPEMRNYGSSSIFRGGLYRYVRFHADPLTGQYQFVITNVPPRHTDDGYIPHYGQQQTYTFYFDQALKLQRYDHPDSKRKDEPVYTSIHFAHPTYVTSNFSAAHNVRTYERAGPADLPVYVALEKLLQAAPGDAEQHYFYLSPTGLGKALVVERPLGIGGKLNVYTF
ncbi:hypothetical protein [Hymenobacter bucti]|uniref:Uncharacterized protein n=1 Tax=Hymenobacter bucti TaxID=1844114 RepID=A0ABW4QZ83_9BACT